MAQKPQSPILAHFLSPNEICTTEYSESMLDDGLILRAPLEQQKWFSDITGLTEQEFRQQIEHCLEEKSKHPGYLEIANQSTGRRWQAGKFEVVALGSFMSALDEAKDKSSSSKFSSSSSSASASTGASYASFEIVTRIDAESTKFVDIGYLQSLPENAGALFQVASNFNGVEAASEMHAPDSHNFVTKYIYDRTQGPLASISAGPAAIARNYGAFVDAKKPTSEWAQTDEHQVNFLDNLKEHFPMENGYIMLNGNEPKFIRKNWKKYLAAACVGVHRGCEVTTGYEVSPLPKPQQIDQVFTAAMNLAQGASGVRNKQQPDGELKSQFLLDVAYHGTYLSALQYQHSKVFLTMIGGGAFGNSRQNIYDSIFLAHQKWGRHEQSKLKVVRLVLYNAHDLSKSFLQQLRTNFIPYKVIVYFKGEPHIVEKFSL